MVSVKIEINEFLLNCVSDLENRLDESSTVLSDIQEKYHNLIETGKNITRLMKKNGIKVTELQEILGFEYPQAIYKWKRGECLPTIDNLIILASVFNTTIDKIIITNF